MKVDADFTQGSLPSFILNYRPSDIGRFGQYVLDMNDLPEPLEPQPLPFEPAL